MSDVIEVNIDSLPGPTHHFGGLGVGNLASLEHRGKASSPRAAALQSLDKAQRVSDTGTPQFLWLPPVRPNLNLLRMVGFEGSESEVVARAGEESPELLSAAFSGAFLWTANAGTITSAMDSSDQRYHFTPANLISSLHRFTETAERGVAMQNMFSSQSSQRASSQIRSSLVSHSALPCIVPLRDEGAANHMRLSDATGNNAINVFVYGAEAFERSKFLPRQTLQCCQAIARQHRLAPENTFFVAQKPEAIAAGAFHNDVVATSHYGFLLFHEDAFEDVGESLTPIVDRYQALTKRRLTLREVKSSELPLEDAVSSYLFNSQIVGTADNMTIFCPQQCKTVQAASAVVDSLLHDGDNPIRRAEFVELDQSMAGGGGPACVRLRVPITRELEQAGWGDNYRLTPQRSEALRLAIEAHYPMRLTLSELGSGDFIAEAHRAREAVYAAMGLSS